MKSLIVAAAILIAAPLYAQEQTGTEARGYVSGLGGLSVALGNKSANTVLEGGVRVAPHIMVFGNLGHFSNLMGDLQPTLDATTANLANTQGLGVTATGSLPATYGMGGIRIELPMGGRVMPYVLGGIGMARLKPTAQLAYATGFLPDGSTPSVGTDITTSLAAAGSFTTPSPSNSLMTTLGGGVQIPLAPHWAVDAGYRYSRIAADTALSAPAMNTNGITFGFGYRF